MDNLDHRYPGNTSTEGLDRGIAKLFSRRFLGSAVVIPVVAGGMVLLTPGAAEAATCGQGWSNKEAGGGEAKFQSANGYTTPLHTGSTATAR